MFHESIFSYQSNFGSSSSEPSIPLSCPPFISSYILDSNLPHSILQSALISFAHLDGFILQVHPKLDDEVLQDVPAKPTKPLDDLIPLRMSVRISNQPSYLQAYHYKQVSSIPTAIGLHSGSSHPLSSHLSYQFLSPSYKHFCSSISSIVKPSYYYQVVSNSKWQEAMPDEIAVLEANNTWTLTPLLAKFDGSMERYKARLVVKGFT